MKGLILKDLYNLSASWKTLIIIAIFYMMYGFFADSSFVFGMLVMIFAMQAISAFSYDKLSGFDSYALTLSVTRRDIVSARYATALLMLLVAGVLSVLSGLAFLAAGRFDGTLPELIAIIASILGVGVFYDAIVLPLIYKFGVEKSRLLMLVALALPAVAIFMVINSGFAPSERLLKAAVVAAPVALAAVLAASYAISQRIFAGREV